MPSHVLAPEVAGAGHVTRLWIGTTWRDRSSGCRSHSLKDVPIVLWFLKFQDHVSGGDCARRIQASPARSRQAPGCSGSPGMKWDDFYVEKQCKSELWCCAALCWRIVDLGIFVGCYTLVLCLVKSWQRDTESRCMKKSRLDEPDEPGSASGEFGQSESVRIPWTYQGDRNCSVEIPFGSVNPQARKRNDQIIIKARLTET